MWVTYNTKLTVSTYIFLNSVELFKRCLLYIYILLSTRIFYPIYLFYVYATYFIFLVSCSRVLWQIDFFLENHKVYYPRGRRRFRIWPGSLIFQGCVRTLRFPESTLMFINPKIGDKKSALALLLFQ